MTGAWTLTDEGDFILNEPYKTKLVQAKAVSTDAWLKAMMDFLSHETPYDNDLLMEEFTRRSTTDLPALEIVDSFIIEALEGTLTENSE